MLTLSNQCTVISMDASHKPVSHISSGKTAVFITKDCFGDTIKEEKQKLSSVPWEVINPATGPLFVDGADVGDILKIEILDIILIGKSTVATSPGLGVFGDIITEEYTKIMNNDDGILVFNDKLSFPIHPMIGVIGTAPKGEGIPTGSPGFHGGNMDCNKIIKGSTLYLPVHVEGGLLAMGDVHAIMGDGEVCVCGAETPAQITVRVSVLKDCNIPTPFLQSGDKVMAIYSDQSMDKAAQGATFHMHQFLMTELGMEYHEAAMLLSLTGDLAICQMVDPLITVRMELPQEILASYHYELA